MKDKSDKDGLEEFFEELNTLLPEPEIPKVPPVPDELLEAAWETAKAWRKDLIERGLYQEQMTSLAAADHGEQMEAPLEGFDDTFLPMAAASKSGNARLLASQSGKFELEGPFKSINDPDKGRIIFKVSPEWEEKYEGKTATLVFGEKRVVLTPVKKGKAKADIVTSEIDLDEPCNVYWNE